MEEQQIGLDLQEIISASIEAKNNRISFDEFHERVVRAGLRRSVIEEISKVKSEPEWMTKLRLRGLELFEKIPTPNWLPDAIGNLNVSEMSLYVKPSLDTKASWDEIPPEIKRYYEELGVPKSEREVLGGLVAQFESEPIYQNVKKELAKKGVIMLSMESAVQKYPDLVREYYMKIFPPSDHKFAALHAALSSGGVFVYVPKNVRIQTPVEGFFVIGTPQEAQFEHTLLIADEGSYIHFI